MGLEGFSEPDQPLSACNQIHLPECSSSQCHFIHLCQLHRDLPQIVLDSWRFIFLASKFPFILQLILKAFLLLHHQNNFLVGTCRNKNPESHCLFIKPQETVKIIAKVQSFLQDRQQHTVLWGWAMQLFSEPLQFYKHLGKAVYNTPVAVFQQNHVLFP